MAWRGHEASPPASPPPRAGYDEAGPRYEAGHDGKTAFEGRKGWRYKRKLPEFSELVMFMTVAEHKHRKKLDERYFRHIEEFKGESGQVRSFNTELLIAIGRLDGELASRGLLNSC